MTVIELLLYLVVAGLCGGIAQSIVGFKRGGCLGAIFTGLVGAVLGTWLARQLRLGELLSLRIGDVEFPVIWSVLGASLFVGILAALTSHRRQRLRE